MLIKSYRQAFKEHTQQIAEKEFPDHLKRIQEEERKREEEKDPLSATSSSRA